MKVKEIQTLLSTLDPEQDVTFVGSFSYNPGCSCGCSDGCYNDYYTTDEKYFYRAEVITTTKRKKTIITIRLEE